MLRNGNIRNYTLTYAIDGETVIHQISERIFTIIGLQPLSLYRVMVNAVSIDGKPGPTASRIFSTMIPQGMCLEAPLK